MISLEQLKAEQKQKEIEKAQNAKQGRVKSLEEKQKQYEKTKKVKKSVEKRQEEIEQESEEIKRKRLAISSAFKDVIGQIKDEYEKVKEDPDSLFSHFFLKDEEGNITKNLNKKKVVELEEIQEKIPKVKKTAEKRRVLKEQKEKVAKTKTKLEKQEKDLYPETKEYLKEKYISSSGIEYVNRVEESFSRDRRNSSSSLIISNPFNNLDFLVKNQPDNIENVRDIFSESFNSVEGVYKIKLSLIKEYGEKLFEEIVFKEKSNLELKRNIDYLEDDLESYKKSLLEVKIYISDIEYYQKNWKNGDRGLDQKISFGSVYSHPLGVVTKEKMKKQEDIMSSIKEDISKKEEELKALVNKKVLFKKEKRREEIWNLKRDINQMKDSLDKEERYKLQDIQKSSVFDEPEYKTLKSVLESEVIASDEKNQYNFKKIRWYQVLNERFKKEIESGKEVTLREYIEAIKDRLKEVKENLESEKDKYEKYEANYVRYKDLRSERELAENNLRKYFLDLKDKPHS